MFFASWYNVMKEEKEINYLSCIGRHEGKNYNWPLNKEFIDKNHSMGLAVDKLAFFSSYKWVWKAEVKSKQNLLNKTAEKGRVESHY